MLTVTCLIIPSSRERKIKIMELKVALSRDTMKSLSNLYLYEFALTGGKM